MAEMVRDSEEDAKKKEYCFFVAYATTPFTSCTSADIVKALDNAERNTRGACKSYSKNKKRKRKAFSLISRFLKSGDLTS